MTGQDIFVALGDIEEDLIAEAASEPSRRRLAWGPRAAGLAAACLCLAALGYGYVTGPGILRGGSDGVAPPVATGEASQEQSSAFEMGEGNAGDAAASAGEQESIQEEAPVLDEGDRMESDAPQNGAGDGETSPSTGKVNGSVPLVPTPSASTSPGGESAATEPGSETASDTSEEPGDGSSPGEEEPEFPEGEPRERISFYNSGASGCYVTPEPGKCQLAPAVEDALEAYAGQDVEFVLGIDLFNAGGAVEGGAAAAEYQRLVSLGYRLYETENWAYQGDNEPVYYTTVVGVFTKEELDQFRTAAASWSYGYGLRFLAGGDSSPWEGTLTPLEE